MPTNKRIDLTNKVKKSHRQVAVNELVYIEQPENAPGHESGAHARPIIFRLGCGDLSPDVADATMAALCDVNPRARQPLRHQIFSWPIGEVPTEAQARDLAETMAKKARVAKCMIKCALHFDQVHVNLHMVIVTTDPQTLKPVKTSFFRDASHETTALMEHKYGWYSAPNALFSVLPTGELVKNKEGGDYDVLRTKAIESKPASGERMLGQRSAMDIAKEIVGTVLADKSVTDWASFNATLAEAGLQYVAKGRGAAIMVRQGSEHVAVKASNADRAFARGKLEEKFGPMGEKAAYPVADREAEPSRGIASGSAELQEAYSAYAEDRAKRGRAGREVYKDFIDRHVAERTATNIKIINARKAALASIPAGRGREQWATQRAYRSVLAAEAAGLRAADKERHARERAQRRGKAPSQMLPFDKWLEATGRQDLAEEFVYRVGTPAAVGTEDVPPRHGDIRDFKPEIIAGSATLVRYSRNGEPAFSDHGKSITFEGWRDRAVMRGALQLSAEKWFKGFELTGTDEFKWAAVAEAVALGLAGKITNGELQSIILEEQAKADAQREHEKLVVAVKSEELRRLNQQPGVKHGVSDHTTSGTDQLNDPRDTAGRAADKGRMRPMRLLSERRMVHRGRNEQAADLLQGVQRNFGRADAGMQRVRRDTDAGRAGGIPRRVDGEACAARVGRARIEATRQIATDRYLAAVKPERIVVTASRTAADGRPIRTELLTNRAGVRPADLPWLEIDRRANMRHRGGGRQQVHLEPLSDRVHHLVIHLDGPRLRALRAEGYHPAAVLQTAPGRFQAILNVPKQLDDESINRQVEVTLLKRLAQEGERRAHSMPGQAGDVGAFKTQIVDAAGGECVKATEVAAEIARKREGLKLVMTQVDTQDAQNRVAEAGYSLPAQTRLAALYRAHTDDIRARFPKSVGKAIDLMIAQRLRATGHPAGDIEQAMANSPMTAKDPRYPQRLAKEAFSVESAAVLQRMDRYIEGWKEVERKALEPAAAPIEPDQPKDQVKTPMGAVGQGPKAVLQGEGETEHQIEQGPANTGPESESEPVQRPAEPGMG